VAIAGGEDMDTELREELQEALGSIYVLERELPNNRFSKLAIRLIGYSLNSWFPAAFGAEPGTWPRARQYRIASRRLHAKGNRP